VIVFATAAWAVVEFETPPAVGEETMIVVRNDLGDSRGGETVRVVHRPGLSGEQELAIGITDGRGRVRWTPRTEGVAWVRAGDEIARVRVEGSDGPPVIPFLVALLLFGGAGALAYGTAGGRR
jgi:hypothetical protein